MTTSQNNKGNEPLAKRVLNRIVDEHLSPRPRWEFLFENYFFWGLGALAVLLGALAFSATIFDIASADWRFAPVTHGNLFLFFLDIVPVLWVGSLAFFILLGYSNIRRTSRGYRYSLSVIALGAVLSSLTLGSALYMGGVGKMAEESVGNNMPFHRTISMEERSWWIAPKNGFLGGQVVSSSPAGDTFVLRDFNGVSWVVDSRDLRDPDLAIVARGGEVRLAGVPTTATSSQFHACFAFPWKNQMGPQRGLPPRMFASTTSELRAGAAPSEVCKDIRPYQQLRDMNRSGL